MQEATEADTSMEWMFFLGTSQGQGRASRLPTNCQAKDEAGEFKASEQNI